MRIVHLITGLELGGAEQMLYNLISHYPDPTTEHIVLYSRVGPVKKLLEDAGVRCELVTLSWARPLKSYKSLCYLLKTLRPDCVHGLLWKAIFIGRIVCFRLEIPFIGVFHSNPIHNGPTRNFFDCITMGFFPVSYYAVSASVRNAVIKKILNRIPSFLRFGFRNADIGILPNGIDTSQFGFNKEDRKRIRDLLKIADDTFVIGAVGRLVPVKRYDWLIEVVATFKHRLKGENILLVIVGAGPEQNRLQEVARELGMDLTVKFVGARTPISPWYSVFDVLAISSASEGMSMALLEALSVGLPIVTTSPTVEHDVIKRGINGFVCLPRDQEGFLAAFEQLIFEPELRGVIAANNRQLARSAHDIVNVALAYRDVFERAKR